MIFIIRPNLLEVSLVIKSFKAEYGYFTIKKGMTIVIQYMNLNPMLNTSLQEVQQGTNKIYDAHDLPGNPRLK